MIGIDELLLELDNDVLRYGESSWLELKQGILTQNRYDETICAFLNGTGGYIIFGVCDNLEIVGLEMDKSLDKFICYIDQLVINGVIVRTLNDVDYVKLGVGEVKVEVIYTKLNKKLLVVKAVPVSGYHYQLCSGNKFFRLNASNYNVTCEKMYKKSDYELMVKEHELKMERKYSREIDKLNKLVKKKENIINNLRNKYENKNDDKNDDKYVI